MEKEPINTHQGIFIKAVINLISNMEEEKCYSLMETNTLDNGKEMNLMEKEDILLIREIHLLVNLNTENLFPFKTF